MNPKLRNFLLIGLPVIVIAFVAFYILTNSKTPVEKDVATLSEFEKLQQQVKEYYQTNNKLPEKLSDLGSPVANPEFQVVNEKVYKLCADFAQDSSADVSAKTGLNADYKQGRDCVTFNAAESSSQNQVAIKDSNLTSVNTGLFQTMPASGMVSGQFTYSVDPAHSHLYKNSTSGDYVLNLYATIKNNTDNCSVDSKSNPCCYRISELTGKAVNGTALTFNRLGNPNYTKPSSAAETDTYGDLPVNFCFTTSSSMTGGLSFLIPAAAVTTNSLSVDISIPKSDGSGSDKLNVTVGLK